MDEPYAGRLVPDGGGAPIPIALAVRDAGGTLQGTVKTSAPLNGSGTIDSGRKLARQCDLTVVLTGDVVLHLYGSCGPTIFRGDFTIKYPDQRAIARGTFHLVRKSSELAGGKGANSASATAGSLAACQKSNTHCLTTCPRGEYNSEFMCVNSCRSKRQACKAKVSKVPVSSP